MSAPAESPDPTLDDLKWFADGTDRVAALTTTPSECLAHASDPELDALVELGRIAFRSPVLVGGIAARSGMSCNTCHRNGRDNPDFFLAGVSGAPGTADVTGGLFSRGRDDRAFNPVPIPSLIDAASTPPFGSVLPMDDLRDFLAAVVVDEFLGQPPTARVAEALHSYVNALQSDACAANATEPMTLDRDALDLEKHYDAILWSIDRHDAPTAEFVLLSLKAALGRIHRRFPASEQAAAGLSKLSLALTPIRRMLEDRPAEAARALSRTREELQQVIRDLSSRSARSFYDPEFLDLSLRNAR